MMLGISFFQLIPEAIEITPKPSVKRSVTMLVIGIALHNIPEGLAIGVGFALSPTLGIMVALGIAVQDVPENVATIVPLYGLTRKRMKSFIITTGTILFEVLGFIFGYCFLKEAPSSLLGARRVDSSSTNKRKFKNRHY